MRSAPPDPPISAYDPSGRHATEMRLIVVLNPVGMLVSVVPSHLMRTAAFPTMTAQDPSGFHATALSWVVTGWPMRVSVLFGYSL